MLVKSVKIISDGKISEDAYDISYSDGKIQSVEKTVSAAEGYVCAGYVDIHTHGAMGYDISEGTREAVDAVGKYQLSHGVTHFCPTFVATPLDKLKRQLKALYANNSNYSDMLPAHLEGPYISLKRKGAQPASGILSEYREEDGVFFDECAKFLSIVTVCPAVKNAPALVSMLCKKGVRVQAGHDESRLPEILDCMASGLDGLTHIYCASSQASRGSDFKKYLGLTEAGLYYDALSVEVIADGEHVSKELFEFILKCKGYKKICLVSDSLSCAGMPPGTYKLAQEDVFTDGKACYLADMSALAGSVASVNDEVQNVLSYGVSLEECVYMAADAPRKYLGMAPVKFECGQKADFNLLDLKGNLLGTVYNEASTL